MRDLDDGSVTADPPAATAARLVELSVLDAL
jgi:hypothetical protein